VKKRYERRYTGKLVPLSLFQQIRNWLRGRGWHSEKYVFTEVFPHEPGYDVAPYAESFITFDLK